MKMAIAAPTASNAARAAITRENPRPSNTSTIGLRTYARARDASTGTIATRPTTYTKYVRATTSRAVGTHRSHQNGAGSSVGLMVRGCGAGASLGMSTTIS